MVGANALLAKVLRKDLRNMAIEHGATPPYGAVFPQVNVTHDPLFDKDDPPKDLEVGILSRDGGHFQAYFRDDTAAGAFAREARQYIVNTLPGLLFDIYVGDQPEEREVESSAPVMLPIFQVCQVTGRGSASALIGHPKEQEWASLEAITRIQEGELAAEAQRESRENDYDIVSLLQKRLSMPNMRAPQDLEELCGNEYLAVIHADGNGIGSRVPGTYKGDFSKQLEAQAFFRTSRAANRAAVSKAIEVTFHNNEPVRPYQILMLGGDDLLLVCRASFALPFLVKYAEELQNYALYDGQPLTIGAGVAIARPTVPFYRLHQIAEDLASSAKRLYRGLAKEEKTSVADWAVFSSSWSNDSIDVRIHESLVAVDGWTLVLSGRPLPILGDGLDCMTGLVSRAKKLNDCVKKGTAARSQLRALAEELAKGWFSGKAAFFGMAPETMKALKDVGIEEPWQEHSDEEKWALSRIPDLVEVFEIGRLGRSTQ